MKTMGWTKAIPPLWILAFFLVLAVGAQEGEPVVDPKALMDMIDEHRDQLEHPFIENDVLCHCTDWGCDKELVEILGSAGRGLCRARGGMCKKTIELVIMKKGENPTTKVDLECVPEHELQPAFRPMTCHATKNQQDRINVHCCHSGHFCNDNVTLTLLPLKGPYDDYGPITEAPVPGGHSSTELLQYIFVSMLLGILLCICFWGFIKLLPFIKKACQKAWSCLSAGVTDKWNRAKKTDKMAEKTEIAKLEDGCDELERLYKGGPTLDVGNLDKGVPEMSEEVVEESFPFSDMDFSKSMKSGSDLANAFYELQEELVNHFANKSQITAELEDHHRLQGGEKHRLLKLLDDLDSASSAVASGGGGASSDPTTSDLLGPSTGVPVKLQQTFASQIDVKREKILGGGRFGKVYKGYWRGDFFAVKTMNTCEYASWARETEIYNTNMLRHNNLLRFVASHTHDERYHLEHWIVTEFHELGDLSDYLYSHTVPRDVGLKMIRCIASGLSYLHLPIIGHRIEGKPAIAHRDLKSKNVLVKNDLTVCIADLGLSVKYDSVNNCIDGDTQRKCGTPRYLSPELLDDSINLANFDSFCLCDIYAMSLIFWEVVRRMDDVETPARYETPSYNVPYFEHVPRDPTQKDLLKAVCHDRKRPLFNDLLKDDKVMKPLLNLIIDMWSPRPTARPTAERVRIKVDECIQAEEREKFARVQRREADAASATL